MNSHILERLLIPPYRKSKSTIKNIGEYERLVNQNKEKEFSSMT